VQGRCLYSAGEVMNTAKRKRLKAKRTPWIKSRHSRMARVIAILARAKIIALGISRVNSIRSCVTSDKTGKAAAIANAVASTYSDAAAVTIRGSKSV
jgi:hypothetical protein